MLHRKILDEKKPRSDERGCAESSKNEAQCLVFKIEAQFHRAW